MECHSLKILVGYFVHVFLVVVTEHDMFYSCSFGREYFFLYATHRQYLSPQRYLSGHSHLFPHFPLCQCRGDGCRDSDAGRRTVFWCCPFRHVDMDVITVEYPVVDVESVGVSLHILQGQHGRLLHYVTEISCECEF